MPKRRVALLLPGLGRVRRGAETAFLELASALSRYPDMEIELFGGGPDVPEGLTVRPTHLVPRERFRGWPRFPLFRSEHHYEELTFILSLIREGRFRADSFDVVLACSYPYTNWFLQWAGGRRRPKQVFVTQNGDWMCRAESREFRWFRCDGLVCVNPVYYERHRNRYPSALIPNGVDPATFRPEPPDGGDPDLPGVSGGGPVVLMVSALIPEKRVADAVRAVALVPGATLVVAGDGPERAAVERLAAALLPGRHALLGSVSRDAMPGTYRRADVFLHLHPEEPFGIAYLEAAASGLPVVAPDAPIPRWIFGETALFADPADPASVAGALRAALDPSRGPALAEAGRGRVIAGWTWEAQAARYRDFFEQILRGKRADT